MPAASSAALCPTCGLDLRHARFCSETGEPHPRPPSPPPVCEQCGLSTPFCAVTGARHGAAADAAADSGPAQAAAALDSGETKRAGLRHRRRPAGGSHANTTDAAHSAVNEAITYSMATARARQKRTKMSVANREMLAQLEAEGFGIFGPGNPALEKVRAIARGEMPPPATESAPAPESPGASSRSHGVDIPERALREMMEAAMRHPRGGESLRRRQPEWLRRVTPAARIMAMVMLGMAGLAVFQVAVSSLLRGDRHGARSDRPAEAIGGVIGA